MMVLPIKIVKEKGELSIKLILPEYVYRLKRVIAKLKSLSPFDIVKDIKDMNREIDDILATLKIFETIAVEIKNTNDRELIEKYVNDMVYGRNENDYTLFDTVLDLDDLYHKAPFFLFGIRKKLKKAKEIAANTVSMLIDKDIQANPPEQEEDTIVLCQKK